ncbi:MAG TPA: radical SAM protein, partial [Anaerolineales bacterium]|nr:radical SAM protein [Anaerolineales bacterium]
MSTFLQRLFPPRPTRPIVPPGLYHQMSAEPPAPPRRLHLRVEPDGRGLLIVNASTVLHLNETATAFAWQFVQGKSEDEAAAWIAGLYRLTRGRARRDARLLRDQIQSIAEGDNLDPVLVMGLERTEPHQARPSAPYRLDMALTYRLADGRSMDPLARRRVDRELTTDEWTSVLDQAWALGIPHVVFVGGEPTVRPDLIDLIRHAEQLGQVSGVVAAGKALAAPGRLEALSAAGLDHLLVVVDPASKESLEGLRLGVQCEVFCAAHLTVEPTDLAAL